MSVALVAFLFALQLPLLTPDVDSQPPGFTGWIVLTTKDFNWVLVG